MRPAPYISGHFEPVPDEITAYELTVHGTLPPELNGRYFRNGHNPKPGITPSHWFRGAGMLHGVRLTNGRAEWYRNRWVRTPYLEGVPFTGTELEVSAAASASRLLVLDATSLDNEPIATVLLPRRVPAGIHGHWLPDTEDPL